ncbi:MAG TPA: hypothetical protein VF331_20675 [Polyangiales bacterium]
MGLVSADRAAVTRIDCMPDYFATGPKTADTLARLAAFEPKTLACMHGSSFNGDGSALLAELSRVVVPTLR